jgi:REP element-mobilizing transposase RayT
VQGRECLFGQISDGVMELNDAGIVVQKIWVGLPERFPKVTLDEFVIMPNHFHGIIWIHNVGAGSPRPDSVSPDNQIQGEEILINQGGETPPLRGPTLGQIMGYFKYQTTKQINVIRDNPGVAVWQRNYFERIIRTDAEMSAIRDYIRHNPSQWADDEENPDFP